MKKNGFTLVELLGVIIILSLLVLIVLPSITNSVKESSDDVDNLTEEMIYKAADLFVSENPSSFPKIIGKKYSIKLQYLIDEEYLSSPIKSFDGEDISTKKCIEVTYNNAYSYKLKDIGTCSAICRGVTSQNKTTGNIPTGQFNIGDEYICEVAPGVEKTFFVLSKDSKKINLIMDSNINENGESIKSNSITNKGYVAAITYQDYDSNLTSYPPNNKGPVTALKYLQKATSSWNYIPNIILNYEDEGYEKISTTYPNGIGYKNIISNGPVTIITGNNGHKTATYNNLKVRMPTLKEVLDVGCKCSLDSENKPLGFSNRTTCPSWNRDTNKGCPLWIYNYLDQTGVNGVAGYYLLTSDQTPVSGYYKYILDIYSSGSIGNNWYLTANIDGVRPVINLTKYDFK